MTLRTHRTRRDGQMRVSVAFEQVHSVFQRAKSQDQRGASELKK